MTLTFVGFGVGERFRRLGDPLLERRALRGDPLRDLRPPLGEGLLVRRLPLPLELERRLRRREVERLLDLDLERSEDFERLFLGDLSFSFSSFISNLSLSPSFSGLFLSIGISGL